MARPFNAHSTHVGTFLNVFVSRRSRDCSKFQLTKHQRTERPTSLSRLPFLRPAWKQMRISTFCKLGEQRSMHVCNFLSKHFVCFEFPEKKKNRGRRRRSKWVSEQQEEAVASGKLETTAESTSKEQNSFAILLLFPSQFLLLTYVAVDILIQIFNKIKATQVPPTTTANSNRNTQQLKQIAENKLNNNKRISVVVVARWDNKLKAEAISCGGALSKCLGLTYCQIFDLMSQLYIHISGYFQFLAATVSNAS